jgi:hypothetical protein
MQKVGMKCKDIGKKETCHVVSTILKSLKVLVVPWKLGLRRRKLSIVT